MLVDVADDGGRGHRLWGRGVGKSAVALDQAVSSCADAGGGVEVVGRVGRADVTDTPDEEVAHCADASIILVDLVLAAGRDNLGVWNTVAVDEVVSIDAHALAKDVIVDLVHRTVDGGRGGSGGGGSVGTVGSEGSGGSGGPGGAGAVGVARAVNIRVGLAIEGVGGSTYCGGLRVEQGN